MRDDPSAEDGLIACRVCGLVQLTGPIGHDEAVKCARCGFLVHRRIPDSRMRTLALSLAAALLFVPANIFPVVVTSFWGAHEETTIWGALVNLYEQDAYFLGALLTVTSLVTPAFKILGLLVLSATAPSHRLARLRSRVYRAIQITDPWNMLEVTLLAVVLALVELGNIATVRPGAGVYSFALVVVLTILATLSFDPRLVWDEPAEARQ